MLVQSDVIDRDRAAVRVSGISKFYGNERSKHRVVAVDDVSLTVREGELVVLLGPSGCGKTTLLRSIAGLEVPSAGTITIQDDLVYSASAGRVVPPEKRNIGMMFQSYALWPHMTVYQNVAYPISNTVAKSEIESRLMPLLATLGISGLEHRYPGELSGGQQQRVALARALISSPSVLLFDEPLSNIDARVRRRLRAQLRELKRQTRFAGIYVTHDQEEAMELADVLAVMENGRIKQIGPSEEVYKKPNSLYVAAFLGEINRLPAQIMSVAGLKAIVRTPIGDIAIELDAPVPPGAEGFVAIRPEQIKILAAGTENPAIAHRWTGQLNDVSFLGGHYELSLCVEGTLFTAVIPEPDWGAVQAPVGGDLVVGIHPDGLRWLAD